MQDQYEPKPCARPAKADRNQPIPLADRRRILRQTKKPESSGQIITDWASI